MAEFDLSVPPEFDTAEFPDGVNVEVIKITGEWSVDMRVHERGSGETLSCGTGAVAAAAAATGRWPGDRSDRWVVAIPGGTLAVTPNEVASVLTGPAVIVAEGETDPGWLES